MQMSVLFTYGLPFRPPASADRHMTKMYSHGDILINPEVLHTEGRSNETRYLERAIRLICFAFTTLVGSCALRVIYLLFCLCQCRPRSSPIRGAPPRLNGEDSGLASRRLSADVVSPQCGIEVLGRELATRGRQKPVKLSNLRKSRTLTFHVKLANPLRDRLL